MQIDKTIEEVLNLQIGYEFKSAFGYLSLAAALGKTHYSGFEHWMRKQYEEELEHAKKLYDYIEERQGHVQLTPIEINEYNISTPLEAFKIAYDLEIENTKHIHDAYALAVKNNDYPTQTFLHWFINEQTEEEKNCQDYIALLTAANNCEGSLFVLDREAKQRS